MLAHWIWLATRKSINETKKIALLEHFGDPEDIYFADNAAYAQVEGMTKEAAESLADKDLREAEKILAQCMEKNIRICAYHDAAYPKRLKNIADPPVVLYYKGNLPDFDGNPVISVVGTRKASAYGMTVARRMGYQIARCGAIVVSGVASGIDSMSMVGGLTGGGTVVGVLGCGADEIYPAKNRSLYADTERNGCLLTEFPPETPPYGYNFPKRNRIISGLACGVLVVEAPEGSGSLITARAAAEQGRDVFVVPGNIDVPTFAGSNALLREGAIAVSSGWDIVSEYRALFPDKIRKDTVQLMPENADETLLNVAQTVEAPAKKKDRPKKEKKIIIDNVSVAPYSDVVRPAVSLTQEEESLLGYLKAGERLVDDVIAESGLPAGKVLATLTLLEVKGMVRRLPGKRVAINQ